MIEIKTAEITIEDTKGRVKTYQLNVTQQATKNEKGSVKLAHVQPTKENKVLPAFGKMYVDTVELEKAFATKEAKS